MLHTHEKRSAMKLTCLLRHSCWLAELASVSWENSLAIKTGNNHRCGEIYSIASHKYHGNSPIWIMYPPTDDHVNIININRMVAAVFVFTNCAQKWVSIWSTVKNSSMYPEETAKKNEIDYDIDILWWVKGQSWVNIPVYSQIL